MKKFAEANAQLIAAPKKKFWISNGGFSWTADFPFDVSNYSLSETYAPHQSSSFGESHHFLIFISKLSVFPGNIRSQADDFFIYNELPSNPQHFLVVNKCNGQG